MSVHAGSAELADMKSLRQAFGTFATGVTVVTVGGDIPHGMTANSFTSVSLDPPLVLVCVDRGAVMHSVLCDVGRFGVSVLTERQARIARYFADSHRPLGAEQFDAVDWIPGPVTGAPLINDALCHFECEVQQAYAGGDHTIFLGRLVWLSRADKEEALLFLRGRFRQIEAERSEVGP